MIDWLRRRFDRNAPADPEKPAARLEAAIAAFNARGYETAEPLFRRVIEGASTRPHDREVARNIYGTLLERTRRVDEAMAAYEANVRERVVGSYPYERLAAIYGRAGRPEDARRSLEVAIAVSEAAMAGGANLAAPLARLRRLLAAASDPAQ